MARLPIEGGRPRRFFIRGKPPPVLVLLLPPATVIKELCSTFRSAEEQELADESAGECGEEELALEVPPPAVTVETMSPLPLTIVTVCEVEGLMRLTRIMGIFGVLSNVLLSFATSVMGDEVALSGTDAALAATGVAGAEVEGVEVSEAEAVVD